MSRMITARATILFCILSLILGAGIMALIIR